MRPLVLLLKQQRKLNKEESLGMCLRKHRELLWRHKGDWKRPESNSNGPHSTEPENTSQNSNFQRNISIVWKRMSNRENVRKLTGEVSETDKQTFEPIDRCPGMPGSDNKQIRKCQKTF